MSVAGLITEGIGPGGSVPYLLTGGLGSYSTTDPLFRGHRRHSQPVHRRRITKPRYKTEVIDGKTYEGTEEEIQAVYRSLEKDKPKADVGLLARPMVMPQIIPIPNAEPILLERLVQAKAQARVIADDDAELLLLIR